jgi:hypothetical protein
MDDPKTRSESAIRQDWKWGDGRPRGAKNHTTEEARRWARKILESPKYRASLRKRLLAGKAPHIEVLLWHYGYGKPREQEASPAVAIQINMPGLDGANQELPAVLRLPAEANVRPPSDDAPNR